MRAVVQRVLRASVTVDGEVVAAIERGLVVLLGVAREDSEREAVALAGKVARLRIFENRDRLDLSLVDVGGAALVVSQFTLLADTRRGNRPSFTRAASNEPAQLMYGAFCDALDSTGVDVSRGVFGARMAVELVNDGPVTIVLDT